MASLLEALNYALTLHQQNRFAEAEELYRRIRDAAPDLAEAWRLSGILALQNGRLAEAAERLERAASLKPDNPEILYNLGMARRALKAPAALVLAAFDQALVLQPAFPEALFNAAQVLRQDGRNAAAAVRFQELLALRPDIAEAEYGLAEALAAQGRLEEALTHAQHAVALRPDWIEARFNLARLRQAAACNAEAEAAYREVLSLRPDWPPALCGLGEVLRRLGRREAAAAAFSAAVAAFDRNENDGLERWRLLNLLGATLLELERPQEARAVLQDAAARQPNVSEVLNNLGLAEKRCGAPEAAAEAFRRAAATAEGGDLGGGGLDDDARAEIWSNLGIVLCDLGRGAEAIAACRHAADLRRDHPDMLGNLGVALSAAGRLDEAETCFQSILDRLPPPVEGESESQTAARRRATHALADVRRQLRRYTEALMGLAAALSIYPDAAELWALQGLCLLEIGRAAEAEAAFRRSLALKPDQPGTHSNLLLCLNYRPEIDDAALLAEHRAWDRRHGRCRATASPRFAYCNDRLRVGYLSPDFGFHPVGFFLAGVLPHHNRDRVEIFCYSDRARPDAMTDRLRAAAEHWRSTVGLNDDALENLIRADQIDVLLDLAGHTAGNRLTAFARRLAPVQATWAGYVGSTGLSTMDVLISDRRESPPGAEAFAVERILRLPDGYICWAPPEHAPPVAPKTSQDVTFGCFNNLSKLSPPTIALWGRLLRRLPQARLVLKTPAFDDSGVRATMSAALQAEGVDETRVVLSGRASHVEMLDWCGRIDVALDPFPYSGGLTTIESLWMGVPVVTLGGTRFCARHSVSHLTTVGLTEFIADGPEQYLEIAAAWAQAPERLARLRTTLRKRVAESPLCDGRRFAENLENAFFEMRRRRDPSSGRRNPSSGRRNPSSDGNP